MIINRLNLIIIGLLLLLLVGAFLHIRSLKATIDSKSSFENLYNIEHQKALKFQDDAGHWRSRAQVAEVTKDNFTDIAELKNLSAEFKELKKNLKNLESYSQVNTITNIRQTVRLKDTLIYNHDSVLVTGKNFLYEAKYDTIKGVVREDSIEWEVRSHVPLEIVTYWDRTWFLGKKKYFCEVKSDNTNANISYQKSIITKRKKGLLK